MASRYFYCSQCHKKYATHQRLFDTLYNFSREAPDYCPACGGVRELHVKLDFQLGTGDGKFKVVSAILPDKLQSWLGDAEEKVTYYPFLIVLQDFEGKQFCWMPYWHVTGKDARYGQHAICLDATQFESLTAQMETKVLQPA